jgi:hypothetical protein
MIKKETGESAVGQTKAYLEEPQTLLPSIEFPIPSHK